MVLPLAVLLVSLLLFLVRLFLQLFLFRHFWFLLVLLLLFFLLFKDWFIFAQPFISFVFSLNFGYKLYLKKKSFQVLSFDERNNKGKNISIFYFFCELRYRLINDIINPNDWNFINISSGTFIASLCCSFGTYLFLSFLRLIIVLILNPLLYFQSVKLYFDWICFAILSLKWNALVDLIEYFINYLDKFIWCLYNFENKTFLF